MFFHGKHLRVKTMITSDGLQPLLDANHQAQFRIDLLPMSAEKAMRRKREKILKRGFRTAAPEIEIVDNTPVTVQAPVVVKEFNNEVQF